MRYLDNWYVFFIVWFNRVSSCLHASPFEVSYGSNICSASSRYYKFVFVWVIKFKLQTSHSFIYWLPISVFYIRRTLFYCYSQLIIVPIRYSVLQRRKESERAVSIRKVVTAFWAYLLKPLPIFICPSNTKYVQHIINFSLMCLTWFRSCYCSFKESPLSIDHKYIFIFAYTILSLAIMG